MSTRVRNIIADGRYVQPLGFLLEFLAAWEGRSVSLITVAYRWCSAISETAERSRQQISPGSLPTWLPRAPRISEREFSQLDPYATFSVWATSLIAERPPHSSHIEHVDLFFATLRVGFRLAKPGNYQMVLYLKQVPHLDYMFETAFSSYDHEIIADAVSVWGTGDVHLPPGSLVRCCIKCVEWTTPFSPRLRRVSVGRSSSSRIVSSTRQGRRLFGR